MKRKEIDYAKMVNKEHKPKVSIRKQIELEKVQASLKSAVRKSIDAPEYKYDKLGNPIIEKKKIGQYEKPWRALIESEAFSPKVKARQQRESSLTTSKDELMFMKQKNKELASLPLDGRLSKNDSNNTSAIESLNQLSSKRSRLADKNDYLGQMRLKRQIKEQSMANQPEKISNEQQIDKLIRSEKLNEYERIDAVKKKAEQMEKQAKQTEKLIKIARVKGEMDAHDNV